MKYKEGSVLIKDIQRRFSQGLEVYSIMTATFFNYPKKVATLNWNGRQPCFGMAGNHGVEYASYSSGQCFFFDEMRMEITLPRKVSIPYSSGQCFF